MRTRFVLGCCLVILLLTGRPLGAQQDAGGKTRTRDLLRKSIKKIDQATEKKQLASALGLPDVDGGVVALEYTVLLIEDSKETVITDPDQHEFEVGDAIRVQIQPINDVYIYIFHEGPSGKKVCLLPTDAAKPPLAKAGQKLDLPDDDTGFVFTEPTGAEKLIVVAAQHPSSNLAALANAIFQKDDAQLTDEEKKLKQKLGGSIDKVLQSVSERSRGKMKHRGLLSDVGLRGFASKRKLQAVLEEPPTEDDKSTFALAANSRAGGPTELKFDITLKSVKAKAKPAGSAGK